MASLSFYDLCKNSVLSAKDLFKYRAKRDGTLPAKGGQKDYEPDGSWIQTKALETFMQERATILSEPRVEKLNSLAQGEWDSTEHLVNISKPGKFWSHMGFTDNKRNWLFPEEALFLIETNALEVYDNGVPLSVQEAYSKFLGSVVSVEEYQVYSYLRRLGYVVLRHSVSPEITPYERKINLKRDRRKNKSQQKSTQSKVTAFTEDQLTKPLSKEEDVEMEGQDSTKTVGVSPGSAQYSMTSADVNTAVPCCSSAITSPGGTSESCKTDALRPEDYESCLDPHPNGNLHFAPESSLDSTQGTANSTAEKRDISCVDFVEDNSECKKLCSNPDNLSEKKDATTSFNQLKSDGRAFRPCRGFYADSWAGCRAKPSKPKCKDYDDALEAKPNGKSHDNEASLVHLPSIAGTLRLSLVIPDEKFLPQNVKITSGEDLVFDVCQYRAKQNEKKSRKKQKEEERDAHFKSLQFSYPKNGAGHSGTAESDLKVSCTDWATYKKLMAEKLKSSTSANPVGHYWEGDVTPLVHPKDATSYEAILSRLSIIQTAENEALTPDTDCMLSVKMSYDVHLPDSKFKKSMPGVPRHRVCVTKSCTEPPSLAELQELWSRFKDDVPIHWAVVDSGEISFFVFNNNHQLRVWKK